KRPHSTIALDGGAGNAWTQFGKLLGQLFVGGKPVSTDRWFEQRGLQPIKVSEYLDAQSAKQIRKPTDWLVSPSGARPAVPTALNSKKRPPAQATTPQRLPTIGPATTATQAAATNGNGAAKSNVAPLQTST